MAEMPCGFESHLPYTKKADMPKLVKGQNLKFCEA